MAIGMLVRGASQTDTGIATLKVQLRDATVGWFVGKYQRLEFRHPVKQAEFLLAETERVAARNPDDPQVLMGAALSMDAPGTSYKLGLRDADFRAFEKACVDQRDELASSAVRLDPQNADMARLRALLLFRDFRNVPQQPIDGSKLMTRLEECEKVDIDNRLYDFLRAIYLFETSASMGEHGARSKLDIHDEAQFERGVEFFDRAKEKPFRRIDLSDSELTQAFVAQSDLPHDSRTMLVLKTDVKDRESELLDRIADWLDARAAAAKNEKQYKMAVELWQEQYRVASHWAPVHKWQILTNIHEVYRRHPDSFSKEELARHEAKRKEQSKEIVIEFYARNLNGINGPPAKSPLDPRLVRGSPGRFLESIAGSILSGCTFLLVIGVISVIAGQRLTKGDRIKVNPIICILALVFVATVVFPLLGLAPAGKLGKVTQNWCNTVLIVILTVSVVWNVFRRFRNNQFKFGIGSLAIAITVMGILCGILLNTGQGQLESGLQKFAHIPFDISLQPFDWHAADLGTLFAERFSDVGVLYVWIASLGPPVTICIWSGLLLVLYSRAFSKSRRSEEADSESTDEATSPRDSSRRAWIGGFCAFLGVWYIVLSIVLLVAFTAINFPLLQRTKLEHTTHQLIFEQYESTSSSAEENLAAIMRSIRSDDEKMELIEQRALQLRLTRHVNSLFRLFNE